MLKLRDQTQPVQQPAANEPTIQNKQVGTLFSVNGWQLLWLVHTYCTRWSGQVGSILWHALQHSIHAVKCGMKLSLQFQLEEGKAADIPKRGVYLFFVLVFWGLWPPLTTESVHCIWCRNGFRLINSKTIRMYSWIYQFRDLVLITT